MAVYTRKNKKGTEVWFADFTWTAQDGVKRRYRKPAKDERQRPVRSRTAAEAFETRLRAQLAVGKGSLLTPPPPAPEGLTLSLFFERYRQEHGSRLKASAQSAVETLWLQHIQPVLGSVSVDSIGEAELARLATVVRTKGRAPKTTNNVLSCIHTILTLALDWGVRTTPVPKVNWERTVEPKILYFTHTEIDRLVAVGDPMVTVAVKTGLRLGELLALRWIDFRDNKITVSKSVWWCKNIAHEGPTKTNRIRVVPLPDSAIQALETLGRLSEFVFCGPDGERLTKNGVKRRLWSACKSANVAVCNWHRLRHSYISELVRLGVPLPQVQVLAGHSKIDMTLRYTHVHAEDLVSAVNRLS